MKPCFVCGVLCDSYAPHCPNCGEASFGDVIDSAPDQPADSPAAEQAPDAPTNKPAKRGR